MALVHPCSEVEMVSQQTEGQVVSVDPAGNLITNISTKQLEGVPRDERLTIICDEHKTNGIYEVDHGQPEMTYIGVIADSGFLQLMIVGESAHIMLDIQLGGKVVLKWT